MDTVKVGITLADETAEALRQVSTQSGASMAALIRFAIADWLLEKHGIDTPRVLDWGGRRDRPSNGQEH